MQANTNPPLKALLAGLSDKTGCDSTVISEHVEICALCQERLESLASSDTLVDHLRQAVVARPELPALAFHLALARLDQRPSKESQFEVGQQLQEYELLEQLGAGGMGVVFRARHLRLDKTVAVKVLNRTHGESPRGAARFERETKAIGQLDHPHIVQAFDAGEANGALFLVMEFLDGLDLSRLVRERGPVQPADACEMIRQAALGLEHAHRAGLIHRDVKPSNLMLTRDGQVKLLDLGLALLHRETPTEEAPPTEEVAQGGDTAITGKGFVVGTREYMAPEQSRDSHTVDARADVYSLGRTVYFLLTGDSSPSASLPPALPRGLPRVLEQMLAQEPARRQTSMREVVRQLEPYARGADLPALMGVARSPRRPRSPGIAVAACLGFLAALVLLAALWPQEKPRTVSVPSRPQVVEPPPQPPPDPGRFPMTEAETQKLQKDWARYLHRDVVVTNGLDMKMALIPPGTFPITKDYTAELTRPYRMATTETTLAQFRSFIAASKHQTGSETRGGLVYSLTELRPVRDPKVRWNVAGSYWSVADTMPVVLVDHNDAVAFCRWLSQREQRNYRLPTEAEWRWACLAGRERRHPDNVTTEELNRQAWYFGHTGEKAQLKMHAVGLLEANPFGLHDMGGNVWEWCADWFGAYPNKLAVDPRGAENGKDRVLCGGSYTDQPFLMFHQRAGISPTTATNHLGFRVVCDP